MFLMWRQSRTNVNPIGGLEAGGVWLCHELENLVARHSLRFCHRRNQQFVPALDLVYRKRRWNRSGGRASDKPVGMG